MTITIYFTHFSIRIMVVLQYMGERWGTLWKGHQFFTGQQRDTMHALSPIDNLKIPSSLDVMFLDCGSTVYLEREPTHARGEYANYVQKDPKSGIKPRRYSTC